MTRIRKSGPKGSKRPFTPAMDMTGSMPTNEKISDALDQIAVSLAAIDHNLEVLTDNVTAMGRAAKLLPPKR